MRKSLLAAEFDRLNGIGNEQSLQRSDSELSQRMHACAAARAACALLSDELTRLLETLETAAAGAQTREMDFVTAGT
jgi:hypothetical protein